MEADATTFARICIIDNFYKSINKPPCTERALVAPELEVRMDGMGRETKQYRDFEEGFGQPGGCPFNILDIKNARGELDVVIGVGVPPARRRVHFEGVTDFDFYTSGGEEGYSLPQRLNSFTYREHQVEGAYLWSLLGGRTEWSFLAGYPEVSPL
jgi:hypothetical protein